LPSGHPRPEYVASILAPTCAKGCILQLVFVPSAPVHPFASRFWELDIFLWTGTLSSTRNHHFVTASQFLQPVRFAFFNLLCLFNPIYPARPVTRSMLGSKT
jgi:hypothetical protein